MMTIWTFCTWILATILVACAGVAESSTVKIRGEIVAVDKVGVLGRMTNIPASQLYIVKPFNTRNTGGSEFVLIRHQNFDRDTAIISPLDAGSNFFVFKTKRSPDCDATLETMGEIEATGGTQPAQDLPRFSWIREFSDFSPHEKLPCFTLKGNGYRRISGDYNGNAVRICVLQNSRKTHAMRPRRTGLFDVQAFS